MIVGQIRLIVVTGTIGVMGGFQNILVMTNGGPGYARWCRPCACTIRS